MYNVHFQVVPAAVGWRVEVSLFGRELGFLAFKFLFGHFEHALFLFLFR